MVDNTFASHLICPPLSLGADLVVESLGKIVNGHSDTMLGLLVGKDAALVDEIRAAIGTYGMASSPLDCYLTQRGLMSLGVRMQRSCQNALAVAESLAASDAVESVSYPGLANHPQHQLASNMLTGGYGWMLTVELNQDGPVKGPEQFMQQLAPEIGFAPSLGDAITTVSHPLSTSHRSLSPDQQRELGITNNTIRISCGIEPTDWLVQRFAQALSGY
jgi:cystathionine beta-lyase/cystathionine gamma-synthase